MRGDGASGAQGVITGAPTATPHASLAYRPEIDGLRAVAVLPIVLFHAGFSGIAGGFVGVDIFFVISGFLITSIIVGEMERGQFSLQDFYRRRIVRIFPALFAMLTVTLLAGIALMFAGEMERLARTTAYAAASISNFHFWNEAGYFSPAAESNPLLHTWSLAVEEQFYVFYPLLLLLVRRYVSRWLRPILWLVVIGSLILGYALSLRSPDAAFYLLPSRAWELGLGGLIAVRAFPAITSQFARVLAGLTGLAAITASYFLIDPAMPVPVPATIPACLGTALIIAYSSGSSVAAGLGHPMLRGIGRISYSVYLWHWPIITFYRICFGYEIDALAASGLIAASLAAGWLSYVVIERPFLDRFKTARPTQVIVAGLAAIAVTIGCCVLIATNATRLDRHSPEAQAIAAYENYPEFPQRQDQYGPRGCFVLRFDDLAEDIRQRECEKLAGDRPRAVLAGDSFAGQFALAMQERYPQFDWSLELASGCRPLVGATGTGRCVEIAERTFEQILPNSDIDVIVLAGRWLDEDIERLPDTLRTIRQSGAQAMLLGPAVQYDSDFALLYARAVEQGRPDRVASRRLPLQRAMEARMQEIAVAEGARFVSLIDLECREDECRVLDDDGSIMRWDYGHRTLAGTRWIAARLPDISPKELP